MSGQQDVVVAGGVEVMSRVPLGAARATGMPYGPKVLARYGDFSFNQGISAEMISQKWGFSRTRLDEYSALSHERAAAAQDNGAFESQMIPVFTGGEPVVADEGVRRGTTRREARRAQAGVQGRRCHPRGQLLADLGRCRGAAGDDGRERGCDGAHAARAIPRRRRYRSRPGADADRSDPGHREGAAQGGRRHRRGRRVRGQRGVRPCAAGVAGRRPGPTRSASTRWAGRSRSAIRSAHRVRC